MARGFRSFRREPSNSATLVTYYVDSGVSYTEKVASGKTVLSPTTFTPTKSGYSFLGWREDSVASSEVLVSKTAKGKALSLYAVFSKDITLTTYNASNTPISTNKAQYYNNTNIVNPTFTMSETAIGGWTNAGWTNSISSYTAIIADGATITLSANAEYYSLYTQTITVTYYNGSVTPSYATGTRIANVHSASTFQDPTFQLAQASIGWTPRGWTTSDSGGGSTIAYENNTPFTISSDITLYGCYYKRVMVGYNANGGSGSAPPSQGTALYHSLSGATNATVPLVSQTQYFRPPAGKTRYGGWSIDGVKYWSGASYKGVDSKTAYAIWS